MDPWNIELIVTKKGVGDPSEVRSASRGVERGLLHRVRQGVHVDRAAWDGATGFDGERDRHIVAMRALAEVAPSQPVFSHWSAGVLHGLPLLGRHFDRVHTTVADARQRGLDGVAGHVFPLVAEEVVQVGTLFVTTVPRTVVDVAGASPFVGGIIVADAALYRGLPRRLLDQAVDLAGPRKAVRRIADVADFAHPGAESPAESENRWTMFRLGIAPQQLQYEIWDGRRLVAVVDTFDELRRIVCEVDGDVKFLDSTMAPRGAGRAVIEEKKREDLVRALVAGLARYGYAEASSPARLRPILQRVGLHPAVHRPTLSDYAAVARAASPRRPRVLSR